MTWRRRRGGNPDQNNQDIADLARRLGCTVAITTGVGWDFPDQVWGFGRDRSRGIPGITILVEVKGLKKQLKPGQQRFQDSWQGGPVVTVQTGQDVIDLLTGPTIRKLMLEQAVRVGHVHESGAPWKPQAVPKVPGPGDSTAT